MWHGSSGAEAARQGLGDEHGAVRPSWRGLSSASARTSRQHHRARYMTSSRNGATPQNPAAINAAVPLQIDAEPEPRGVRIRLRGEVDLAGVDDIRGKIDEYLAAGCQRVVLDLRGVTFLDSSGVHLILDTDATARAAGWQLLLIEGPPWVQQVFELAGVRDRLPFAEASPARMDRAARRPASPLSASRAREDQSRGQ
jgi:anti-sigma B factor antagonist